MPLIDVAFGFVVAAQASSGKPMLRGLLMPAVECVASLQNGKGRLDESVHLLCMAVLQPMGRREGRYTKTVC